MPRFRAVSGVMLALWLGTVVYSVAGPTEAPAAFDNKTNGFITQVEFDRGIDAFNEIESIASGLGPLYNAESCGACHGNPVTGGISQVTELRAGHLTPAGEFVPAPGGSLVNDRAIDPTIAEYVPQGETIRTLRTSLNTLGDGFVEAIDDATLRALAIQQAEVTNGQIAGVIIEVPVLEASGAMRVGRFGWKNQHASLLSFAGDAYLNEMGITNRLVADENTAMGNSVAAYDTVADPEDSPNKPEGMHDIDVFAAFMRATKAPPRDFARAATSDAVAGSAVFDRIGCNICHVRTLTTAPSGTPINGGTLIVPDALGNKIIHPFGDFLLHDVGTGDGIVQNGGPATARLLRTAPLWGLRTRARMMHDGASLTFADAIQRHGGEAAAVSRRFRSLSATEKSQLFAFLSSL
jgi:CxxC motif-containing protein (DUF1111 family)